MLAEAQRADVEKCNIDGVFFIASGKPRVTVCFPSISKVFTNGLGGSS
jgi:hypothetical protein